MITLFDRKFGYNQNLSARSPAGLSMGYQFIDWSTDYGPHTPIPGITLDPTGQVKVPANNGLQITNPSNPGADYTFKVRVTDAKGAYADRHILLDVVDVAGAQPPVLGALGDRTIAAGTTLTLNVSATDPNGGDVVNLRTSALPANAVFTRVAGNPASGTFTFSPSAAQLGTHTINFEAVDPLGLTDSEQLTITVIGNNKPPVLEPIGNKNVPAGGVLSFTVKADDPDGDPMTLSMAFAPSGATFQQTVNTAGHAEGVFTWTAPVTNQVFSGVKFQARDTVSNQTAEETINISVGDANRAPSITTNPAGDRTIAVGSNLSLLVTGNDPDAGDIVTLTTSSLPAGATFSAAPGNPASGTLSFVATTGGIYGITFTAKDNGNPNLSTTLKVTITVLSNRPPTAAGGSLATNEDTSLALTLQASDPDGDPLTWDVEQPHFGTLAGTAPNLVYTPAPNFNGQDHFHFKVNDGTVDSSPATVYIQVNPVNDAPTLGAIGNKSVAEESALTFSASGGDVDGDGLTFSLASGPAGASISAAGAFSWTPTEAQGPGSFSVTVVVTDTGGLSDSETFSIQVDEVNRAPALEALKDATAQEGTPVTFTAKATDPDLPANTLTFSLASGPAGATVDPATGAFSWTPTEAQGPGSYTVEIQVTDGGGLFDKKSCAIAVEEVNQAPVLDAIAGQSGDEETAITFTAKATDGDIPANSLTFSLVGAPAGAAINPTSGKFTWTPTEAQGPGSFTFGVKVTDNGTPTLADEETVTVTVAEVNRAPVLGGVGSQSVDEGTALTFTAKATDPDLPANGLSYSLAGAAAGASIDASTGAFAWTPTEAQGPGSFTFVVKVTDNGSPALSDAGTITVTVAEVNEAPVLASIGSRSLHWGNELAFTASATDVDLPANTLTFSLAGAPAGAAIHAATGKLTWTPGAGQIGPHTFTVKVTDNGSPALSDEETITVTVTKRPTALEYAGALTGQYSDPATVKAVLKDIGGGTLGGSALPGLGVTFALGTQAAAATTDAAGAATSSILLDQGPAGLQVQSAFAGTAEYVASSDSDPFQVLAEDARVTYTGPLYVSTSAPDSSVATFTLRTTVRDITAVSDDAAFDSTAGVITHATVTFVNRETGAVIGTAPVTLLGSDPTLGTASLEATVDIGAADSQSYTIATIVTGYYTRSTPLDDVVVTVSKPVPGSITGGGYLVNARSGGLYAGDAGAKTNYGFNARYNRSGKNVQGHVNVIVRQGGRVYQIKGNAMASLSVQKQTGTATLLGKANITDVTNPNAPVSLEGGVSFQLTMTDRGEPGTSDSLGITVWRKNGTLLFSSAWNGAATVEQTVDGGNLQVH